MPIAALDAGDQTPPVAPDAVPMTSVRLAGRMAFHRKRKLGSGRRLRKVSWQFAALLFWLVMGAL